MQNIIHRKVSKNLNKTNDKNLPIISVVDIESISLLPTTNIDPKSLQIVIPVHKVFHAQKG
jgi:hypothetical protein